MTTSKCEGTCKENKKFDVSRVCCAVKVALLWKRQPDMQESHFRVLATQISEQHAAEVRKVVSSR